MDKMEIPSSLITPNWVHKGYGAPHASPAIPHNVHRSLQCLSPTSNQRIVAPHASSPIHHSLQNLIPSNNEGIKALQDYTSVILYDDDKHDRRFTEGKRIMLKSQTEHQKEAKSHPLQQNITLTIDTAYPSGAPPISGPHPKAFGIQHQTEPFGSEPWLWHRLLVYAINLCCGCLAFKDEENGTPIMGIEPARKVRHHPNGTISITDFDHMGRRWDYQQARPNPPTPIFDIPHDTAGVSHANQRGSHGRPSANPSPTHPPFNLSTPPMPYGPPHPSLEFSSVNGLKEAHHTSTAWAKAFGNGCHSDLVNGAHSPTR